MRLDSAWATVPSEEELGPGWLAGSRGKLELGPAGGERAGLKDSVSVTHPTLPPAQLWVSGILHQCGIVT